MTRTRRRRSVLLLLSALLLVPAFLLADFAFSRAASADGCWANRELVREERKRKEEEEKRRQREENERKRKEEAQQRLPPAPPTSPVSGTPTGPGKTNPGSGGRPAPRTMGKRSFRETWRGWWLINDRALLPPRAARLVAEATPSPDGRTDGVADRRERVIRLVVLPAMRGVLDPDAGSPQLMLRGSLMGLGKGARTEDGPALLAHWLDAEDAPVEVREAAALGVGLLRRTDPALQFEPDVLDALRGKLMRIVEDEDAPEAVRATCAISIGLLGDQPFGGGVNADGHLVVQKLWRNLASPKTATDLTVGLLTALGRQPAVSVTEAMRADLHEIAKGRSALGRTWNDVERGNALAAVVQLEGSQAGTTLRTALTVRRVSLAVRRAALIALGRAVPTLSAGERTETARALRKSLRRVHDPLTRGLANIAIGHLLDAQVRAGGRLGGDVHALLRHVQSEARNGSTLTRGFAAVGLGLAFRSTGEDSGKTWLTARRVAARQLLAGLESGRGDEDQLGAYAVALGLMRERSAVPALVSLAEARDQMDLVRWDAAVALAQIGDPGPAAVRALNVALFDRHPRVRSGAALGLSMLRGPMAGRRLLRELEHASSTDEVARLTEPLGCLLDPTEASAIAAFVTDEKHTTYARASMLVALGNVADPERHPSLGALGLHANYPGDVPSLMAAVLTR